MMIDEADAAMLENHYHARRGLARMSRRKKEIYDVETFVIERCDATHSLKLATLTRLSDKDLAWLSQAVKS